MRGSGVGCVRSPALEFLRGTGLSFWLFGWAGCAHEFRTPRRTPARGRAMPRRERRRDDRAHWVYASPCAMRWARALASAAACATPDAMAVAMAPRGTSTMTFGEALGSGAVRGSPAGSLGHSSYGMA
jgi:hypothetical protein